MSAADDARDEVSACDRCLRSALELFDDTDTPSLADPAALDAVLSAAEGHLVRWLSWASHGNADADLGYDALDGITVVRALLAAGLTPRNSDTIDPRRGALRMVADRIERIGTESDDAWLAKEDIVAALEVSAPATTQ